jgi:hypothetical protein
VSCDTLKALAIIIVGSGSFALVLESGFVLVFAMSWALLICFFWYAGSFTISLLIFFTTLGFGS